MSDPLSNARRIVVKTGSALVADAATGAAKRDWIIALFADLAALTRGGTEIVLVSSGAIALARPALFPDRARPLTLEQKQAAAAVGQPILMAALTQAAAAHDLYLAQALLTLDDTERRRRWLNARATLLTLLSLGRLPVINENDTVATDEIRYGDNDRLAARVAQMLSADTLLLLSDIDGVYTGDPRSDPTARHLGVIEALGPAHHAMAGGANAASGLGSGGMATKLVAADIARSAGCRTLIADGRMIGPITRLRAGARHTRIEASDTPETARRQWLAGHLTPKGQLHVDGGALAALKSGASLLPVGVTRIDGQFDRGDAVSLLGPDGEAVGKGITAYSATDLKRILGRQSHEIANVLGEAGRTNVVHRDDLVLNAGY